MECAVELSTTVWEVDDPVEEVEEDTDPAEAFEVD
jgi:hypothetical protein